MSDRRLDSKQRLAAGLRCFRLVVDEVGLHEFLLANNCLAPGAHTPEQLGEAVSQWLGKLILEHKQKLESDTSLQSALRCEIVWVESDSQKG
jgi:hypothetical protein